MFLYKNCIYYIWQRAIKRAADESGAFKNVSEDDLAQYVGDTAKLFADQVLAEAQMRNEPIDAVLKASDIVYEDGGIKLNVQNEAGASGIMMLWAQLKGLRVYLTKYMPKPAIGTRFLLCCAPDLSGMTKQIIYLYIRRNINE